MPKNLLIDPKELRKAGELEFKSIPLNKYNKTIKDEKKNFSKDDILRIYRDMKIIREFENMLFSARTTASYKGIDYKYTGPAHLYLGEEASAVGQAYVLDVDDYIFGSHRSHGEIIAKGLSAINKLSDKELLDTMENFLDGKILNVVLGKQNNKNDVKELAVDFLIYGAISEIFGRETGFARGLGNSMHAFFTPFGIYPNNAIVGGSGPIAVGAGLYKKVNKKKGIVVANLGDGSLGCGPVWESMNMAAMEQFDNLWEEGYEGGLPILFNFINNQYGMSGQTSGETMAFNILARIGAGINEEQLYAERVDGYNPFAVIDAVKRKKEILLQNKGPALLDVVTYRTVGHSTSDPGAYRSREELQLWEEVDSIKVLSENIISEKIASYDEIKSIDEYVEDVIFKLFKLSIDDNVSPRMDFHKDPNAISDLMYSNEKVEKMEDRKCNVLIPKEDNNRVKKIKKKERVGIKNGKPVSKVKAFSFRDAIFESIIDKFYADPTLISFGEDCRDMGGAFGVYQNLYESIPYHRLFNTPISESAIVGAAVGYAMCGGRAIPELMYCDFLGRAGDEVFNQLAKWQSMSAGIIKMPVVLRVSVGSKYGAQHSQDWTSLCTHIPGLKVVFPATPYDAKGLMNSALSGTDPVVFFESQRLYDIGEMFNPEGVPEKYYEIPIGEADIKRKGNDITILSIGSTLYNAIKAAELLEEKYNVSAEVIDARSLVPFNYETVLDSVKKTGKIILTSDACERGSHLNDIARNISEMAFDDLDGPPVVVGARNWITPCFELEEYFFPQPEWMLDAIHEKIMPLEGHEVKNNYTLNEQLRRNKLGV